MKACPFCGSDNVGYAYRTHPDGHEIAMIACSDCGAHGPVRTYTNECDDDESIASWDKRQNLHTSTKHTPGQWYAIQWSRHAATTVVVDDPTLLLGKRVIAECETEADARLVAATQDLLALAHQIATECGDCSGARVVPTVLESGEYGRDAPCEQCADIWAVIDQAEGRP